MTHSRYLSKSSRDVYDARPSYYGRDTPIVHKATLEHVFLLAAPLVAGLYALHLGQDTNWDLQNYHFYDAFAYLTHRMGHDVAVSFSPTYYNPLLHIPFYYAVTSLPPRAVGFMLGLIQGFNIWPLYGICLQAVDFKNTRWTQWLCFALALMGVLGSGFLSEIGTSFGDNLLSLPVLTGIWLIMKFRGRFATSLRTAWMVSAAAGVLAGAAVGLKLPFALYSVGIWAAHLGLALPLQRRLTLAFASGLGIVAGLALTSGFWMLEMWEHFGNPIFPHFNQYFKSAWADTNCHCDNNFIPKSLSLWLLFPLWFTLDPLRVGELPFRDLRFALLFVLSAALLGKWLYGNFRKFPAERPDMGSHDEQVPAGTFILVFMWVSFALWMIIFSIYRYLLVCEMLAPLCAALLLRPLVRNKRGWMQATLACSLLLIVTVQPADWGRKPWTADYFGVHPPVILEPENTIVLLAGYEPMAYMVPSFPQQVRFLRIQRYLESPPNETDNLMRDVVDRHAGKLFTMYRFYEEQFALETLKEYGLELDRSSCLSFLPDIDLQREEPYLFCQVEKSEDSE